MGGQTHKSPFATGGFERAHTELPKAQHPFYPAVDRLRDENTPLA